MNINTCEETYIITGDVAQLTPIIWIFNVQF